MVQWAYLPRTAQKWGDCLRSFLDSDFLLSSEAARQLFHGYAEGMPIFDFHNHLPVKDIREDTRFETITQLWLGGDHYKWRAMRALGVEERFITGDAAPLDKFVWWGRTVERLIGCPLHHWSHLELQRYFDIHTPLNGDTAEAIYHEANERIAQGGFSARTLLTRMKVRALCTTDDPADSLEHHLALGEMDTGLRVLPAFRPDAALKVGEPGFAAYLARLSEAAGQKIHSLETLKQALDACMDRFDRAGCLLSDHGFTRFRFRLDEQAAGRALAAALAGQPVDSADAVCYLSELMVFLGRSYARRGWAMQLHLGALRSANSVQIARLGPDTGFDSVGEPTDPFELARFLDALAREDMLPRTVLYCLNPADNPVLATMAVNFCEGPIPGKVQLGSAWWFNDTLRGMSHQLDELMENGLLSSSVGMLTDSRSFTSYARHEYFRRLLCEKLGQVMEAGLYPMDLERAGRMVQDVCYHNAVNYFGLERA